MKNFAKILMLLLVVALTCGLVVAMSITSSADAEPIEVDSWQDIIDAYATGANPVNVKLTDNISVEGKEAKVDYQSKVKNLVIDLNGYTLSAKNANCTTASDWGVLFGIYNRGCNITVTGTGAIELDNTKLFKGHVELNDPSNNVAKFGFSIIGTDDKNPIKVNVKNTAGSLIDGKDGTYNFKNVDIDYVTAQDAIVFNIEATLKHTANYILENVNVRLLASNENETPVANYNQNSWMFKISGLSAGSMNNAALSPADVNITAKNCSFLGSGQFTGVGGIVTVYTSQTGVWNSAVDNGDGTVTNIGASGTGTTKAKYDFTTKMAVGSNTYDYWMVFNSFAGKDTIYFENCDIDYGVGSAASRIYLGNGGSLVFKNCDIDAKTQDFINVCGAYEKNYVVTVDGGTLLIATNAGNGNSLIASYNSCEWGFAKAFDGQYGCKVTPGTICSLQYNYQGAGWKAAETSKWGNVNYGTDEATGMPCGPVAIADKPLYYEIKFEPVHIKTGEELKAKLTANVKAVLILDNDIEVSSIIASKGDITLMMNGKTIKWTGTGDCLFNEQSNSILQIYGPGNFEVTTRLAQPYAANAVVRINDDAHNTAESRITCKKTGQKAYQIFMIGGGELSVTNFEVDGNGFLDSHLVGSYGQNVGDGVCRVNLKNVKLVNGPTGNYALDISQKEAQGHGKNGDFVVNIEDCYFESRFLSIQGSVRGAKVDIKNSEWALTFVGVLESFNLGATATAEVTLHEGVKVSANAKSADWQRTVIGLNATDIMKCEEGYGLFLTGKGVYETKKIADEKPEILLKGFGSYNSYKGQDVYLQAEDLGAFLAWCGSCTLMGHPTMTLLADVSYKATAASAWGNASLDIDLNGHTLETECASGVYYIFLLQKSGESFTLKDSAGNGKLVVKNQQFMQVQKVNFNIAGTEEHPVVVEHKGGGYFVDLYNGTNANINYLNMTHGGSGYIFSTNLTNADDNVTIKNSTIAGPEVTRFFHMEETRETETRFFWTKALNVTVENCTFNTPKATLLNHKVANAPCTFTIKDSNLTMANIATYYELGKYAGTCGGLVNVGDEKDPAKFVFTMTGGSFTLKNNSFNEKETNLNANVLFTEVNVTCDYSTFLNAPEMKSETPMTFKDCTIRHNGGDRFANSIYSGNRFMIIDGGTFSAAGTDALCWKVEVKAGTVFDKLDYLKNNNNGMAVDTNGVAIIKVAEGFKVVAMDDEALDNVPYSIYRANTQPNKHYTLACFETLAEALAEVKGGDVLDIKLIDAEEVIETSYTWNVPEGKITVNLCGNSIEAANAFINVANETTLTINGGKNTEYGGCIIADTKLLTVNNAKAVVKFVGEDAEDHLFVLATGVDTGMIEIVAGSVELNKVSIEAYDTATEEPIAKEAVLLGTGYSETDTFYNGEAPYHMYSITNGETVIYGDTLDALKAAFAGLKNGDKLTLLDNVTLADIEDNSMFRLGTAGGAITIDLGGYALTATNIKTYSKNALFVTYIYGHPVSNITITGEGTINLNGCGLFNGWCDDDLGENFAKLFFKVIGTGKGITINMNAAGCDMINTRTYDIALKNVDINVKDAASVLRFENGKTFPAANACTLENVDIISASTDACVKVTTGTPINFTMDADSSMNLAGAAFSCQKRKSAGEAAYIVANISGSITSTTTGALLISTEDMANGSTYNFIGATVTTAGPLKGFEGQGTDVVNKDADTTIISVEPTTAPALKANLTLYSNIAYNIYVSAADYAKITAAKYVKGEIEYELTFAECGEYYVATIEFGAAFIADKFDVEITADGETYVWEDLSVLGYASAMMANTAISATEKTAIASMVAYAQAVATLIETVPDELANFDVSAAKTDAAEITAGEAAPEIEASYAIGSEAGIRLHATEGEYTITFAGENYTHNFAEDNDLVIVIRAYHMGEDVTVGEYNYNIANFADASVITAAANYAAAAAALAQAE